MGNKIKRQIDLVLNTFNIGMKLYVKDDTKGSLVYILRNIDIRITDEDNVDVLFYLDGKLNNMCYTLKDYGVKFFTFEDMIQ